jgi:conjugative relaxase-like TrwC/TraI family protein
MLSIKILSSSDSAAKYYSHGDYYGSEGEGKWFGDGKKDFNLNGEFTAKNNKEFKQLLDGIMPDGKQLGRTVKGKRQHNPGTDLTFSAPKSFSIEMLVNAYSKQKVKLENAMQNAVESTLSYIEKSGYIFARKGAGGKEQEPLKALTFATFMHTTNRNLEPQVHVHSFLANAAKCSDGKYRNVNIDNLLAHGKYFGQIFRSELAMEVKKLGIEIRPTILSDGSSSFELSKINPMLIDAFLTRRKEIVELCKELGITTKEGRDKVVINSRKAKKLVKQEDLKLAWNAIAKNIQPHHEINEKAQVEQKYEEITAKDLVKLCIDDISYNKTVFSSEELIQKTLKYAIGRFSIDDIKTEINNIAKTGYLIEHVNKFTTKDLLKKERQILKYADQALGTSKSIIKENKVKIYLQRFEDRELAKNKSFTMNDQQRKALQHILASKDKIITMEGLPGVGKSTVLNGVRDISGRKIINLIGLGESYKGLAPTASSSKTLEVAAKIESTTLHSFLNKYKGYIEGRGISSIKFFKNEYKKAVIFVDEASLISTNMMHNLLTLQERFGFRLVLTGDTKQLSAAEAGKPFEQILSIIKPVKLQEIVRQKEDLHKQAVIAASEGKIAGTFAIHNQSIKATNSIAKDAATQFLGLPHKAQQNTLLISPTRKLRDEINNRIIEGLNLSSPKLEFKALRQKDMSKADYNFALNYTSGDIIKFNKNYQNGINKNDYLKIKSIDKTTNSLILEKNNKEIFYQLRANTDYSRKLEAYQSKNMILQEGLKIIFNKNDKANGLINSETAQIDKINKKDGTIKLTFENGKSRTLPAGLLKHIDYGYCITVHAAQGKTYANTIAAINNNKLLNNQKMWLVVLSRHKSEFTALVEDKTKLQNDISKNTGQEVSAMEFKEKKISQIANC